jgi:hypothetical protein
MTFPIRALVLLGAGTLIGLAGLWFGRDLLEAKDVLKQPDFAVANEQPQSETPKSEERTGASSASLVSHEAKPISVADFKKLREMIKPRPGEANWAEIPWMTNLWEARRKAAAEGKPLFVWSASADALGCT